MRLNANTHPSLSSCQPQSTLKSSASTLVLPTFSRRNAVLIKHLKTPPICYDAAVIDWVRHFVENKPKGNTLVFMTLVPEIERNGTALRRDIPALKGAPDALCSSQICTGLGNRWFRQSNVHCLCHWYVLCRSDTLIRIVSPSIVLQIAAYRSNSPTTPEWE